MMTKNYLVNNHLIIHGVEDEFEAFKVYLDIVEGEIDVSFKNIDIRECEEAFSNYYTL